MEAKDYLLDCIYFEITEWDSGVMNRYMFIRNRWIRGDDNFVFTQEGMIDFVNAMLHVTNRKLIFDFYGRKKQEVIING